MCAPRAGPGVGEYCQLAEAGERGGGIGGMRGVSVVRERERGFVLGFNMIFFGLNIEIV